MDDTRKLERIAAENRREYALAQVGGFRPPDDPATSWFGGNFVAHPDEPWPTCRDRPMWPLLQVRLEQTPLVPEPFADQQLVTVFVEPDLLVDSDIHGRAPDLETADTWEIRAYDEVADLEPLDPPEADWPLRPFPIRWETGVDYPSTHEIVGIFAYRHGRYPDATHPYSETIREMDHPCPGTKLRGWPSWIQEPPLDLPTGDEYRLVLQIASEPKSHWNFMDSGNIYLLQLADGEWDVQFDFF